MTSPLRARHTQRLRHAVARAVLAPSVHNTQPWRFVIRDDTLELFADRARRLRVLDPGGRQLVISCGAALFNARVALAADGYDTVVARRPEPDRPDLLARLTVATAAGTDAPAGVPALAALDEFIPLRQSNRRRFADEEVPPSVIDALVDAAAAEDTKLFPIERAEHRLATARLSQDADRQENADPGYRAELRAWTTSDPERLDGVPALAVPHVDAGAGDDLPIRDFDTHGLGWLPIETHSTINQCLLLLGTPADDEPAWLRAGEGLQHVLLEITRLGYAASMLTQAVEVARTRAQLRFDLGLSMNPHVLMRVGRAPVTPASRRRPVTEVTTEID